MANFYKVIFRYTWCGYPFTHLNAKTPANQKRNESCIVGKGLFLLLLWFWSKAATVVLLRFVKIIFIVSVCIGSGIVLLHWFRRVRGVYFALSVFLLSVPHCSCCKMSLGHCKSYKHKGRLDYQDKPVYYQDSINLDPV